MAILPVSSVSFGRSYSNLSFEGEKRKQHTRNTNVTSTLKAAPVAALIALSPLNSGSQSLAVNNNAPVERLQSLNIAEDFDYIPKPEHFNILAVTKDEQYDKNTGSTIIREFKLIDTDGDSSDYELIEYVNRRSKNGKTEKVLARGIIRAVTFSNGYADDPDMKVVRANGITLDKNDLNNYAPANEVFYTSFLGNDFYEFFKEALETPECRALWNAENTKDYIKIHNIELNTYKKNLISSAFC